MVDSGLLGSVCRGSVRNGFETALLAVSGFVEFSVGDRFFSMQGSGSWRSVLEGLSVACTSSVGHNTAVYVRQKRGPGPPDGRAALFAGNP